MKRRVVIVRQLYDSVGAPTLEQLRLEARAVGVNASTRTLRRYLLLDGGVRYTRRKFPREALRCLAAREQWAKAMTWNRGLWYRRLVFSDEKLFVLDPFYQGSRVVWTLSPDDPRRLAHNCRSKTLRIMAFGVFTFARDGTGHGDLCIVPHASDGSVNGEVYFKVLRDFVAPFMERVGDPRKILLEDNASPHRACGRVPMPFERVKHGSYPAHSPDFNAIERLWAMTDTTVKKILQTRSTERRQDVDYVRKLLVKTFRNIVKGPAARHAWAWCYKNLSYAAENGGNSRNTDD